MPFTRLSLEERIRCVRLYSTYDTASDVQKAWRRQFGTNPPCRKTITALNKKFDETGSVADLYRSGRPKSEKTEAVISIVEEALAKDPTKSIRSLSSELGVNKAAVHRIKQDAEKRKSAIRLENKKLKEKIVVLQRRVLQFETRLNPEDTTKETSNIDGGGDQSQLGSGQHTTTIICTNGAIPSAILYNSSNALTTYTVQVLPSTEPGHISVQSGREQADTLQQPSNVSPGVDEDEIDQVELCSSYSLFELNQN